ncbi:MULTISPECIES: DUF1015 domain-containing protein [Thermoanaerobacter]|uniref:DUF1015 domain-containing protein n=1 Tax=Thermoanaerobacter TaxID=1754 RepID=UPI00048F7B51|nr:DUF1015 family protein [Thermoanaerobacter thermocopriae]
MATVKPFKAIRPVPGLADKIASLPYDVVNTEEARNLAKDNPYSFLHVDRAEIDLAPSINPYNGIVYEKARENFDRMLKKGLLIKDNDENYYIYREIMNGRSQVGLVAAVSIDEYLEGIIKKHELTLPEKEQDRINHMDYCDAHTSPVFLTYKANQELKKLLNSWMESKEPIYDFTSEDEIRHTVWIIDDKTLIDKITSVFKEIGYLYIADGHHRAAASVKVGLKRREQNPDYKGDEEFNYFLAVLVPHDEVFIMPYNRVVKDLNGYSESEFIEKLKEKFEIEKCNEGQPFNPSQKHTFGMYLSGNWYKLTAKEGTFNPSDPIESLDVSILQKNLLDPILGIKDPRTDKRIDFVGGIRGLEELERRVNEDMKVAFSMHPTTVEDLIAVADAGMIMPPKSTWFEPKLRSGLFIHELS